MLRRARRLRATLPSKEWYVARELKSCCGFLKSSRLWVTWLRKPMPRKLGDDLESRRGEELVRSSKSFADGGAGVQDRLALFNKRVVLSRYPDVLCEFPSM
jgi:hypothetical protein